MKILFATSEAIPYYKSGGLADVSRALPDALAARGHEVRIIHPLYRAVRDLELTLEPADGATLSSGPGDVVRYHLHRPSSGAPATLVEHPVFDVEQPYEPTKDDPLAAARRFALFCRAIVEHARALDVDVVHLNDWQTGLVPACALSGDIRAATVFAIHNLAYQGNFPRQALGLAGLSADLFRTENGVEFHGLLSFMKSGLALSDKLVTVSPSYAREIRTPEFGAGMDGLLRFRRRDLHGILNGIDPAQWDPSTDAAIPTPYAAGSLAGKEHDRRALVSELGFDPDPPIFVMVTRLAHQKGLDLLLPILPDLLRAGASLAVLGDGDAVYAGKLRALAAERPQRVAIRFGFDDAFARLLYAGGDFFLMPSIYEPCGLGQMIAQRYGTPPVVRHTGGLADTVSDGETGFVFHGLEPADLLHACARAIAMHKTTELETMRARCMRLDRSWDASAHRYEQAYVAAIGAAADVS